MTPLLFFEHKYRDNLPSVPRGFEIDYWFTLCNTFNIESYCILDGGDDMLLKQKEFFVKIDSNNELLKEDVQKAIQILNKKSKHYKIK